MCGAYCVQRRIAAIVLSSRCHRAVIALSGRAAREETLSAAKRIAEDK
jgi:hypothetical protein